MLANDEILVDKLKLISDPLFKSNSFYLYKGFVKFKVSLVFYWAGVSRVELFVVVGVLRVVLLKLFLFKYGLVPLKLDEVVYELVCE